ncbi:unnamed protein product [Phytophthora fragariaefolia]|uniref:Unnamed protein product n=1 Tax=Phytophthora fragariaefolia TaxID=1490495 RepID=A0A9W6Y5M0_9STRA|nr:unnamed protein product [Phytophthora fragariaefolia]
MCPSRSLVVTGVGSMAEALSMIKKLSDDMKEIKPACKRLCDRVEDVFAVLQSDHSNDQHEQKAAEVITKYHQFLNRYQGKELVHRVVEHSTMMDQLRQLHEEVAALFELLSIKPVGNWGEEWEEDHRLQKEILAATVKTCTVVRSELQDPRTRDEALLLLKFEIEQRGERNDDDVLGLMKSTLSTVLITSKTADKCLPAWFLPLYELEYESKPFARRSIGSIHRGAWGEQTDVAIKFFMIDEEVMNERMQGISERELTSIFSLSHPNTASMLGASHISLPPFIVYKFAANGNLSSFLGRSDNNKRHAWRLLYEAALGLRYIHENNIVHGNLKLSNILIDADGHAMLSDFGLSTLCTYSCLSQSKIESSTPKNLRWRAPECLKRRPTFASDIYSFAMCIIEATIGEPPFAFLPDDDVRDNLRKGEIPDKPDDMPDEIWGMIVSMTNFDPAKRVGLEHILDTLKHYSEKEMHKKSRELLDEYHLAMGDATEQVKTFDTSERMPVTDLVSRIGFACVDEQENLMQRLVEACINDEQRSQLYQSQGVPTLIDLVQTSDSHFMQVCAMLILSWVVNLDSKFSKQEFQTLRGEAGTATSQELAVMNNKLSGANDQENIVASMYCAGIGTLMKGNVLQDPELISHLVAKLRSGNDTVRLWAVVAVGKFAHNDVDRTTIANNGAIAPVLVLLQSGNRSQKLWAAYALAKLCQDNEANSVAVASCGAIPLLLALLHEGDDRQKEFAALALGHLAFANDNSCGMIASVGAIKLLITLLRVGSGRQKQRAGFALGSLMSRSVDNCTAIEVDGGIELLVSLLVNGTDDQKESAAFALGTFVARGDVKSNVAELSEATTYLISLLTSGNNTQKELAALTLGTFSVGAHAEFLAGTLGQATGPLVSLIKNGGKGPQEQAAFAISHFAGMNDTSRIAISREGVIPVLISLLEVGSGSLKEYAALGLGNLALNNTGNCVEIARGGAIPLFISLLANGTEKQKLYAALAVGNLSVCSSANSTAVANVGGISFLMIQLRSGSESLKEAAAFALARLAINETNCSLMMSNGAIPILIKLLQSENDRLKEQAAYALSEFADKSYENCAAIVREGGVALHVELLRIGTDKQREYAAMTLSFICGEDELNEHRVAISRAGAISPLVALLRLESDPLKRWAALGLGSLVIKDDANCAVIQREGAIPVLVSLLRSSLDRHKENAAFALGRLAAYSSDESVISALENAAAPLVMLMQTGTEAQKEEAAFDRARSAHSGLPT